MILKPDEKKIISKSSREPINQSYFKLNGVYGVNKIKKKNKLSLVFFVCYQHVFVYSLS